MDVQLLMTTVNAYLICCMDDGHGMGRASHTVHLCMKVATVHACEHVSSRGQHMSYRCIWHTGNVCH